MCKKLKENTIKIRKDMKNETLGTEKYKHTQDGL